MKKDNNIVEIITESEAAKRVIMDSIMQIIRVNFLNQMLCVQVSTDNKLYAEIMTGLIESENLSSVIFQFSENFEEIANYDQSKSEVAVLQKEETEEIPEEKVEVKAEEQKEESVEDNSLKIHLEEHPKVVKKEGSSQFTPEQLEKKKEEIKKLFTEKGWRMSQKEITEKMKVSDRLAQKFLQELCEEGIIEKRKNAYEKKRQTEEITSIINPINLNKNPVKTIFDEEKYAAMFDYAIQYLTINEKKLKTMFPKEDVDEFLKYSKEKHYIKEVPDASIFSDISYTVLTRIRVYYIIKQNPGIGDRELRQRVIKVVKNLSTQELSNTLNIAKRKQEIIRMDKGYFINPEHEM